ncbi:MAG TPA: tetratricopeptide repeat protein, partial [Methanocorpusculum sp.]|nr:tetratricopeptide repeat protein [Methanocorpusculum sp.]
MEKNKEKSAYWLEKSADQGNAQAQYHLGFCYFKGEGVSQDKNIATYWWDKAKGAKPSSDGPAKVEDSYAEYRLADAYYNGNNCEKDIKKAVYWYNKAAQMDGPNAKMAQIRLGEIYYAGFPGVPRNLKTAEYWYKIAALHGYRKDMLQLADLYLEIWRKKIDGIVDEPDKETIHWYVQGSKDGSRRAGRTLGYL